MDQHTQESAVSETQVPTFIGRLSGYAANGLRYWESRRVIFNIVLVLVVAGDFVAARPQPSVTLGTIMILFLLAVLANVCYCGAYIVDLFVQFSGLHGAWGKGRIVVLVVGTAFAAVIAHFVALAMFTTN